MAVRHLPPRDARSLDRWGLRLHRLRLWPSLEPSMRRHLDIAHARGAVAHSTMPPIAEGGRHPSTVTASAPHHVATRCQYQYRQAILARLPATKPEAATAPASRRGVATESGRLHTFTEEERVFSTRQRRAATYDWGDCVDKRRERLSPPISHARKGTDGLWYVAVTWGSGRKERLGPYKTEAVAEEIIKAQLAAWLEGQKLFLKPPQ